MRAPRPAVRAAISSLGLLVVGDGEHAAGLVAPVDDQVAEPLGEHPGLARPGRGDDPGRAGAVGDGRQLVGGQRRPSGVDAGGATVEPARLDGLGVDHGAGSVDVGRRARGPPSTQAGAPSGRVTSAGACRAPRPRPSRAALRPHHHTGSPPAGVVGVGPHQEVQPVEPRLEARASRHGSIVVVDRAPEGSGSTASSTTTGRARPAPVQRRPPSRPVGEHGLVDGDDRRGRPGRAPVPRRRRPRRARGREDRGRASRRLLLDELDQRAERRLRVDEGHRRAAAAGAGLLVDDPAALAFTRLEGRGAVVDPVADVVEALARFSRNLATGEESVSA